MSECARKYAAAIAKPFSSEAEGCCLPYPPDRNSLKATGFCRFTLTADASGNAWVLFSPSSTNDNVSAWYNATTGTIPMTITAANTAPTNYNKALMSNLPFTGTNVTLNVDARLVAVGFRITYLGKVTDMAGIYFSYVEPSHANVNTSEYSVDDGDVLGALETKLTRITSAPFEQGFTCVNDLEHSYAGQTDFRSGTTSNATGNIRAVYPWDTTSLDINNTGPNTAGWLANGAAPIVFGVRGATAGSTFQVQLISHLEYVGKGASYGLTPSHNDHNAANAIQAAAERATAAFQDSPTVPWSNVLYKSLRDTAAHAGGRIIRDQVVSIGAKVARSYGPRTGTLALIGG